jgi:hypothetical protein
MTGPFPDKVVLPKAFAKDNAADYESELVSFHPHPKPHWLSFDLTT